MRLRHRAFGFDAFLSSKTVYQPAGKMTSESKKLAFHARLYFTMGSKQYVGVQKMSKELTLAYSLFEPVGECRAAMVVVHGMAEHRRRYDTFAMRLSEQGLAVLTFDLRGHGESVADESELGFFGHKDGWLALLADIDRMVDWMRAHYPNVPLALFGHSMGSMLCRGYMKRYDTKYDGVILCGAPNYQSASRIGHVLARVVCAFQGNKGHSGFLRRLVDGSAAGAMKDEPDKLAWLSYNEQNREDYKADPLCGFPFTNRGYADMLFGNADMHDVIGWKRDKAPPILVIAGAEDPCTGGEKGVEDTVETLRSAGYADIETNRYPGCRHEILNEDAKAVVTEDVIGWLNRKLLA